MCYYIIPFKRAHWLTLQTGLNVTLYTSDFMWIASGWVCSWVYFEMENHFSFNKSIMTL